MPPPTTRPAAQKKVSDVLWTKTFHSLKRLIKSTNIALSRLRYIQTQPYRPPERKPSLDLDPREQSSNLSKEEVRISGALPNHDCCGRHLDREGCLTGSCAVTPQTSVR